MAAEVIGVLSLQGAITPHIHMLDTLGYQSLRVTSSEDLVRITRLIMPGGESTTMLKLLDKTALWEPLKNFCLTKPVWGTCAGAILLAEEVESPPQRSLGVAPIKAVRNAYGSQLDSFKTTLEVKGLSNRLSVDFIRAPKLFPLNDSVEILSSIETQPVLLRYKNILVSSFHTELGEDTQLHSFFATM